jgi:DNA-directed RNA polymerase alpha subunit
MSKKIKFTIDEAKWIGEQIGIDWSNVNAEQFRIGLGVELEHGKINPVTNVTNDDLIMTAKIALAHLSEIPDYYDRLEKMEREADEFWKNKKTK